MIAADTIPVPPSIVQLESVSGGGTRQQTGENRGRPAAAAAPGPMAPAAAYDRQRTNRGDCWRGAAVTDALAETIGNAVYSNLPERYRYDGPRAEQYVQQLTLMAATVFQKQVIDRALFIL